jgi:uncharacterized protein (TIGR02646 family)
MITVRKSMPPPSCLEREKEKTNGDYKCGNVVQRLKEDFENKCYICEYKEPPSINVEHFKPHKGDRDLKFDWDNLFWACVHCNNIKGHRSDDILNCTHPGHNVQDWIKYDTGEHNLKLIVKISALRDELIVQNTAALLLEIYNGTTPLKIIESENIRKALKKELWNFRHSLDRFIDCEDEDEKAEHLENIRIHLKRSSAFTAFKRWIVKSNPFYREEFEQYFD